MALFLGTVYYFWQAFFMIVVWSSGLVEQAFFFLIIYLALYILFLYCIQ